jgi:pimeloyl-ACP methyl ester carboxylesterase
MGAVAALMYAEYKPQQIDFMILDSPFSTLLNMVNDAAKTYVSLPEF